jgi:predicted DNA-binding transcriptional regulator AlpA
MASTLTTEALPALIDAKEIGELCGGKTFAWAAYKLSSDLSFPQPVADLSGRGGKRWWRRAAIEAWWAREQRGVNERKPDTEPAFAGEMATQFIRGWFDPPHKQIDRRRRIEHSRLKGVKNQKRIHLQGDWR